MGYDTIVKSAVLSRAPGFTALIGGAHLWASGQ